MSLLFFQFIVYPYPAEISAFASGTAGTVLTILTYLIFFYKGGINIKERTAGQIAEHTYFTWPYYVAIWLAAIVLFTHLNDLLCHISYKPYKYHRSLHAHRLKLFYPSYAVMARTTHPTSFKLKLICKLIIQHTHIHLCNGLPAYHPHH